MSLVEYQKDVKACKKIKEMRFLPPQTRVAAQVLSAFFSLFYDVARDPLAKDPKAIQKNLVEWKEVWKLAYDNAPGWAAKEDLPGECIPVLRAAARVFHEYGIPYKYSEEFIAAMAQDTEKVEYQTYGDLEKFMYGSVSVVCLALAHVIGFTDKRALLFAEEFGYAIALTSYLRDIKKDLEERGHMYLPKAERDSFGITKEQLLAHTVNEPFTRFMGFQMSRARALYVSADEGIALLREEGRFSVRILATLSEAILDEIEAKKCDVFSEPIRLSFFKKWFLVMSVSKAERKR